MPNIGSIAVWCVPAKQQKAQEACGLETHFNYWRISKSDSRDDFFEFGVMLDDPGEIDAIKMFFPWKIDASQVEDCAKYFAKHPDIVLGIFNTVASVTVAQKGQPRCIQLASGNGNIFCRVHTFAQDATTQRIDATELEVSDHAAGTILTITDKALIESRRATAATTEKRVYFRLRIAFKNGTESNPFVESIRTFDRYFQPGYDYTEFIDFRLNEVRTLPDTIITDMENDQATGRRAELTLVAFLAAVPVQSQLTVSNFPSHKMRRLEHNIWTNYAANIPSGMVVYHWKREAPTSISDFSTFVKLQTRRTGGMILFIYLLIVFLVGLAGSLGASLIWEHSHPSQIASSTQQDIPERANQASHILPQVTKNSTELEKKPH